MNESKNPEAPKQHGWSIIQKAQIVFAVTGVLLTITALLFVSISDPHHFGSLYALIGISLPSLPLYELLKAFGIDLLRFRDINFQNGEHFLTFACTFVICNGISYTIMGTI